MLQNDDLFELIHSLTKAEKRYFKLFCDTQGKEAVKKYLDIFDAINRMEVYEKESLERKFENLGPAKTKLIDKILESMRAHYVGKDFELDLNDLLFQAKFLRSRKLYDRSLKALKKAEANGEKFEIWEVLLKANELRRMIVKEVQKKGYENEVAQLRKQREELLEKIMVETRYFNLVDDLLIRVRQKTATRTEAEVREIREVMSEPLFQTEQLAVSFRAKKDFYFARYLAFQAIGEKSKAHDASISLINWWENHPHFIEHQGASYKITLSNHLNSCHSVGDYSSFPQILEKIKSRPVESLDEEAEVFQNISFLELIYLVNQKFYDRACNLAQDIESGLARYASKINPAREMAFKHNLAVAFFVAQRPGEALSWINQIPTDPHFSVRNDIQDFALIFKLILQLEKNGHVDDYMLRNSKRALKNRRNLFPFEDIVFRILERIGNITSKTEEATFLADSLNEIIALNQVSGNQNNFGLAEIIHWLELKTGKSSSPVGPVN
ncbi:MAG: hypothetical protein H6581_21335 [Bacteroidia bacterium]|nr:hypothetical protein [Bacteroidia bacterium]